MLAKILQKRAFSVSQDLILSASMGYSGKETPTTHLQHAEAIQKLNLFDDARIAKIFQTLDKQDFCQQKFDNNKMKWVQFNPYSLDPQEMGHNQVLTSTVMHAVTLQQLLKPLSQFQGSKVRMLDVGCGKGYSTLAYSMLANQIAGEFSMTGLDYHANFMERCGLNLEKYSSHLLNGDVKFRKHDFLNELIESPHDIVTFGFEISLDILHSRKQAFAENAHILVPLSEVDSAGNLLSLEQDFCLLKYANGSFDTVTNIMKTAFSRRIDKDAELNEQIDQDFFLNSVRSNKLAALEKRVNELETQFKQMTANKGKIQLAELMLDPEIKQVLVELRTEKKKLEKLQFAMSSEVPDQVKE